MIGLLLVPVGLVLLGLVLVDVLWTTLAASASVGPMTARTSALAWRVVRRRWGRRVRAGGGYPASPSWFRGSPSSTAGGCWRPAPTAPRIQQAGPSHLTYPVLHFFDTADPRTSAPVATAVRFETVTLAPSGVAADARLADPLAPPDLHALRSQGVPTVDEDTFEATLGREGRQRCLVAGLPAEGARRGATLAAARREPDKQERRAGV